MKSLYKSLTAWFLCLVFVFSNFTVSFADVNSLMIGTSSNALMTLELDDSDYLMMTPRSSIANISNTVQWDSDTHIGVVLRNDSDGTGQSIVLSPQYFTPSINGLDVAFQAPSGWSIEYWFVWMKNSQMGLDYLPPNGTYQFSMDISSQFSYDYSSVQLWSEKNILNAQGTSAWKSINFQQSSGDLYVAPLGMQITNCNMFNFSVYPATKIKNIDFLLKINFTPYNGNVDYTTGGSSNTQQDYENDVSSSLSDLSSSVGEVSDEIGFVAEAIQNLQGAMEPHYSNVLTQLHHITEQLHAFYDQIYNNIHLKEYALWQDIKTAIENIDLEVNVNLDKLKTSIDNMSTAIQNKLQSVTDTITGGYDNSGMESENNELSGAVDELDQAEKEVLDDVSGYIEGFEYPSFDGVSSGIIGALSFLGGFLHSMFLSMGSFGLVITFSLTMIFVLIIVGYHRIRS